MSRVQIPKGPIELAGLLWKPTNQIDQKGSALIVVHPGGGVKEQTASLYASKLASQGFTTVTYDAAYQGESGGEPHFLEDPNSRVSDVYAVANYVSQQPGVNPDRIGVVGVCAGGGYAVAAAKGDHRLKAVATVSMVNIGDGARLGWFGDEDPKKAASALDQVAPVLTAEAGGTDVSYAPYVPPTVDESTPSDLKQAHDYYLTARCQHPNAQNKMLVASTPLVMSFDAYHLADSLLNKPTLLIVGEKAESRWHTEKLDKLIGGATEKIVVPQGTHIDFYDKPEYVDPSVDNIARFMKGVLT